MAEIAPFRLPDTPGRSDLVAKYFRALGDPTRLRVLGLLRAEGELSAGALTRSRNAWVDSREITCSAGERAIDEITPSAITSP